MPAHLYNIHKKKQKNRSSPLLDYFRLIISNQEFCVQPGIPEESIQIIEGDHDGGFTSCCVDTVKTN